MNDFEKQKAQEFGARNSFLAYTPSKFKIELPEERILNIKLNGFYSAIVKSRGGEYKFDDATVQKIEKVSKWMKDDKKRGLLLCGTLGNGKTTMLKSISLLLGNNAEYMEAKTCYNNFAKSLSEKNTDFYFSQEKTLLIDDLGVEEPTYNGFGQIYRPLEQVLLSRYKTYSTTIIATNLTFEQINSVYGERVGDRMKEMFSIIFYKEPSFRGRK